MYVFALYSLVNVCLWFSWERGKGGRCGQNGWMLTLPTGLSAYPLLFSVIRYLRMAKKDNYYTGSKVSCHLFFFSSFKKWLLWDIKTSHKPSALQVHLEILPTFDVIYLIEVIWTFYCIFCRISKLIFLCFEAKQWNLVAFQESNKMVDFWLLKIIAKCHKVHSFILPYLIHTSINNTCLSPLKEIIQTMMKLFSLKPRRRINENTTAQHQHVSIIMWNN